MLTSLQPSKPLDLDSIAGLDANEWKTRSEAIELFYELVRTNPEGVTSHISKVSVVYHQACREWGQGGTLPQGLRV